MERKIQFETDNYYHIYNRGVEKRKIFLNRKDYERFLFLLFLCNGSVPVNMRDNFPKGPTFGKMWEIERGEVFVDIGAYCLMPNHFHLLLKEKNRNGISDFMRKLCTAYAMYFNRKNDRSGTLFQSKFRAQLIDENNYLKYMFAYIHLNPIKLIESGWDKKTLDVNKVLKFLGSYTWSSYLSYLGKRTEDFILNKGAFPQYFEHAEEFEDFIKNFTFYKGRTFGKVGPLGIYYD